MTKLPAAFVICLVGCTSGIGDGTVTLDNNSIGAVSAWAEPGGAVGADNKDYMGWTIHFTHAEPGTGCDVAPDITPLASIEIITNQVDTDPSNFAGKAQRAVLATGDVPVIETYPDSISATFALVTLDAGIPLDVSAGSVTITSFGDSIEGSFSATGTEATSPPSQAMLAGTFKATRCLD
jgi:hypothetical protein